MYQLNEKIRNLKPYDPISGEYAVRLDANESFLACRRTFGRSLLTLRQSWC